MKNTKTIKKDEICCTKVKFVHQKQGSSDHCEIFLSNIDCHGNNKFSEPQYTTPNRFQGLFSFAQILKMSHARTRSWKNPPSPGLNSLSPGLDRVNIIVLSFTLGVRDLNLDRRKRYAGRRTQKSFHVRVGEYVQFPCPELAKVIQLDGEFKWVTWDNCYTKNCDDKETKWAWMAGMNRTGIIKVNDTGIKLNNYVL